MDREIFDIFPKVVRSNEPFVICVRGRNRKCRFAEAYAEGKLTVKYIQTTAGLRFDGTIPEFREFEILPKSEYFVQGDTLCIHFPAIREGEFYCYVECLPLLDLPFSSVDFKIYALDADLYELRPLRGDLHVHTNYSQCGSVRESPEMNAVYARRFGLDFSVISDHCQYEPSLIAEKFIKQFDTDFLIVRGEEAHVPKHHFEKFIQNNQDVYQWLHVVNFGGNAGVTKYVSDHFDEFRADVVRRAETKDPQYSQEVREAMAAADYFYDKIHEFGGMAIFVHPFLECSFRCPLPEAVLEDMLKSAKYDAMEIIGSGAPDDKHPRFYQNYTSENHLNIALWEEECIKHGKMIPVVGSTDSHVMHSMIGRQFTIVLAKENTAESIIEAVKAGRSVAIVKYENRPYQLYGPRRIMRFADFLMREYYPEQEELCELEGAAMLAVLKGDLAPEAVSAVNKFDGKALYNKMRAL